VSERRTPDATLINALRILARDIQSGDGCANACLLETATRLEEFVEERRWVSVGERLPEIEERVDVSDQRRDFIAWRTPSDWRNEDEYGINVTHWRKRTPGPEGNGNG
jgi:hypothetical protein